MNDSTPQELVVPAAAKPNDQPDEWYKSVVVAILQWPPLVSSALVMVGLPTLVAAVYFGLIASDVYTSETRYSVRSSDRVPAADFLSAMLSPSGGSSATEDAQVVKEYIRSRDMLSQLESRLGLRAHYSGADVDWISRLPAHASEENFLEYYRHMVGVGAGSGSDITVLRVRAYTPEMAQNIAEEIISLSELLINQWSERITEDTLRFARKELDIAETQVRSTSVALTQFRNQSRSVDPGEETSAVLSIITGLEGQLAGAKAELIEAESFMRSDSAKVTNMKGRVSALTRQIENERTRLAGESGTDLTRLISGYGPLILDQKLAEQRYTSALKSLEAARAEAQRKQRYLIAFVKPELPDEALEPHRVWNILTVFVGALLFYAISSLFWAAINEHIGR